MFNISLVKFVNNFPIQILNYRPQRSWGKVMFSQACVILLTEGVSASVHAGIPPVPPSRHPLGADPPGADTPWSKHPPRRRHPPEQTPSQSRHPGADTPQEQTPPRSRHPPRADTPQSRHPLRCRACWEIRSTRGRYASYWNAILLKIYTKPVPSEVCVNLAAVSERLASKKCRI